MNAPVTLRDLWTEAEQLAAYVALISDPQLRDWTSDLLWINRLPSRLRERFVPIMRPTFGQKQAPQARRVESGFVSAECKLGG